MLIRLVSTFLFLSLPSLAFAAPPFPGGLLDSTGRTAYLGTPTGMVAIELARGEVVWETREAHRPILVAGDRLYALALSASNRLSIVAFDLASKANRVFATDVTDFPRWVATRDTPTQSFHVECRQSKNKLLLDWHAATHGGSGPAKQASGTVQVDLDTGRAEPLALAVRPPRPNTDATPPQFAKLAVRWHGRAGGQLLAVVAENLPESTPRQRHQRLVLRGWDARSGKETTAPRELLRGGRVVVLADLDGMHLWLRDAEQAEQPWQVVSILDGHLVRRVPYVPGTQVATIVANHAYCLGGAPVRTALDGPPRRIHVLHAVDVETGKVAWQRVLSGGATR